MAWSNVTRYIPTIPGLCPTKGKQPTCVTKSGTPVKALPILTSGMKCWAPAIILGIFEKTIVEKTASLPVRQVLSNLNLLTNMGYTCVVGLVIWGVYKAGRNLQEQRFPKPEMIQITKEAYDKINKNLEDEKKKNEGLTNKVKKLEQDNEQYKKLTPDMVLSPVPDSPKHTNQ